MSKHKLFITFIKKINLLINNLLNKYLNNISFSKLSKVAKSYKFFFIFVAATIIFFSYVLIPNIHDKAQIRKEISNQLFDKYNLSFKFSKNLKYHFFPRPHFTSKSSIILKDKREIANIKKLKIYVSLNNLFSLENIEVKDLILKNANFNQDYLSNDFFIKLLNRNFQSGDFIIEDSNIFYRNKEEEVLFINKIKNMKYYYDSKDLINVAFSKNEVFNIPYSLRLHNDNIKKKFSSKLNIGYLRLQIEDELDYSSDIIKGSSNIIFNQKKDSFIYELTENKFFFNFFDKLNNSKFTYKGKVNFKPFYSSIKGTNKEIDFSSIFANTSLFSQLFKTEVLNNKNLNFELSVTADKIKNYFNFVDIFLNIKIQEGLIDLDNTKFSWNDFADLKISNSLIFLKDKELILDGKLDININDSSEIYKSLLTPKNYRIDIKNIEANFNYNFDQKILEFKDIRINNKINQNFNKILKSLIFKDDKLQNKVYFKNTINKAIKAYAG